MENLQRFKQAMADTKLVKKVPTVQLQNILSPGASATVITGVSLLGGGTACRDVSQTLVILAAPSTDTSSPAGQACSTATLQLAGEANIDMGTYEQLTHEVKKEEEREEEDKSMIMRQDNIDSNSLNMDTGTYEQTDQIVKEEEDEEKRTIVRLDCTDSKTLNMDMGPYEQIDQEVQKEEEDNRMIDSTDSKSLIVNAGSTAKDKPRALRNSVRKRQRGEQEREEVKDEPVNEEYDKALAPASALSQHVKDEPEDEANLKISAVFSLGGASSPNGPAAKDIPRVLKNGVRKRQRGEQERVEVTDEPVKEEYDKDPAPANALSQHDKDNLKISAVFSLGGASSPNGPAAKDNPRVLKNSVRKRQRGEQEKVEVKDEPVNEEYDKALAPTSALSQHVKDEPEDEDNLKISAVFSLGGASSPNVTSASPVLTTTQAQAQGQLSSDPPSVPASKCVTCSGCMKILTKGQMAYQKKGSSQLFCSKCVTLYSSAPSKVVTPLDKRTCYSCLKEIMEPKHLIKAPVDVNRTIKDFCSQTCLSSFNFIRNTVDSPLSGVENISDNNTSEEESCSECSESEYLSEGSLSDDSCASPFKKNASKKPTTAAWKPVSPSKKPASASKKSVNPSKKPASASKKSVNPSKKPASASKKSVSALEKPEGSLSADTSPFKMQSASDDKKYEEKSYSDCSGSEYLPEESMSEDSCTPQFKNKPDGALEKLGDSLASPFKMQSANATEPCDSTVDGGEPTLWVKKINKAEKRKWDKKHYCVYCSKPQSKIARHLQRRHTQEVEVSRAISFPKGSKKRKILFEKLRNKGDYHHNVEVLQKRDGEIITWRQPTRDVSPSEYLPCRYCLALFVKHDLWKHQKSCKIKPDMKPSKRNRVQAAAFCLVLTKDHASEGSRQIMDKMRIDSISSESKSDPLICKYAEILYEKHKETELGYCAQKTRELGRFMLTVKSIDSSVKTLRDVCVPARFRLAVSAARKASGHTQQKRSYHPLSLACKLGYSLKRVAEILVGESVQKDDFVSERDAADFIKLIDTYWTAYVSRRARTDPKQNKWKKDDPIPLKKDVVLLQEHPKALQEKSKRQLSGATAWKEGLESTSENNGKDTVCISVPDKERSSRSSSPNFDWDADDNEIDTERGVGRADVKRPPRK